jgi:hypothetical protein
MVDSADAPDGDVVVVEAPVMKLGKKTVEAPA